MEKQGFNPSLTFAADAKLGDDLKKKKESFLRWNAKEEIESEGVCRNKDY
jgi:hypothetical protein